MIPCWTRWWWGLLPLIGACQGDGAEPRLAPAQLKATAHPRCAEPATREQIKLHRVLGAPFTGEPVYRAHGAGALVADFDGDDHLDLMVFGDAGIEYYRAPDGPGKLVPSPAEWLGTTRNDAAFGGAAADYDADGDVDVFVTRYGRPDLLLRNRGDGRFDDVAESLGLTGPNDGRHAAASWGDVDGDGDLDLIVAGHGFVPEDGTAVPDFGPGDPTLLFRNEGDGTFVDISDVLPAKLHDAYTFVPSLIDLDGDGDLDLYAANDFGRRYMECLLLWNEGGTFVLDDGASGLDLAISAMGVGIGDLNGDTVWDLILPAWGSIAAMVSTPRGRWVDVSDARGLVPQEGTAQTVAWGAELADLDNDGDLDLPVVFGYIETETGRNRQGQPNGLWLQDPDGSFRQVAPDWNFDDRGAARGLAVADLNDDGYLDLVVPDLEGPSQLYVSVCGDDGFLAVRLESPGANRRGIGARVQITTPDGAVQQRPMLAGGTSLGSGGPAEIHFGLGDHASVDLTVWWPDGQRSDFIDVASRQTVTVVRE